MTHEELTIGNTDMQVFHAFRRFARQNPDFRTGSIDAIDMNFTTTERVEDPQLDSEVVRVGYEFYANRYRSIKSKRPQFSSFVLGLVVSKDNIALPTHIAIREYEDLTPDEAVLEAGQSRIERRAVFSINSQSRMLTSCDSIAYFDSNEVMVSILCSCVGQKSEPIHFADGYIGMFNESSNDIEEGEDDKEEETQRNVCDVPQQESLYGHSANDETKRLSEIASLEDILGLGSNYGETELVEPRKALAVLESMQNAIANQFGLPRHKHQ